MVTSSVQLLTGLLKCQKFFNVSKTGEVATMPADEIILLLENCGQMASAGVEMLQAQLELHCSAEKPLLRLDNTNPLFWRALFLRLQMMCSKVSGRLVHLKYVFREATLRCAF